MQGGRLGGDLRGLAELVALPGVEEGEFASRQAVELGSLAGARP